MNLFKTPAGVAAAFSFALLLAAQAQATIQQAYYIAPTASGCNDNNPGTEAAPFCTLSRARDVVRTFLSQNTLSGDVTIYLRGGVYEIAGPLVLEPQDSGKDGHYVVYASYPGEQAMLSAGKRLALGGWTLGSGGIYSVSVPEGSDFRQLYVNERRAIRARQPNAGDFLTLPSTQDTSSNGLNLPAGSLSGVIPWSADTVEISIPIEWMHKRLRVSSLATNSDGSTRAVINPTEWAAVVSGPQGNTSYGGRKYWMENAKQFLDAPGEFYLDRPSHTLYYKPWPGQDMAAAEVVVPVLESIFVLNGSLGATAGSTTFPVAHIRIENLVFAHTNWTRPNSLGFVDVQANSLVPPNPYVHDTQYRHDQKKDRVSGAIHATTADDIVIDGNRFARLGGTAILFTMGGNDNQVVQNSIVDVAGGGIEIGNDAYMPLNPRMFPSNNKVANNFIARTGLDYFGSVGIVSYYTTGQDVSNNELNCLPYSGISQGWGWTSPSPTGIGQNHVKYNVVRNYGNRIRDGGGIYLTGAQPGSTVENNYLNEQNKAINQVNGGPLYPDESTTGYQLLSNVIEGAPRWLYIWTSSIHDNTVTNNFSDTSVKVNKGTNNIVSEPNPLSQTSLGIVAAAGIDPLRQTARLASLPNDIVIDDADACFTTPDGTWPVEGLAGNYGGSYVYASTTSGSAATATARWRAILPNDGDYSVYTWYASDSTRAKHAKYTIHYASGTTPPIEKDQTQGGGAWVSLGKYNFKAGADTYVELSNLSDGSFVQADAIRFIGDVIVDNGDYRAEVRTGTWNTSSSLPDKRGDNYRYASASPQETATFRWTPNLPIAGFYNIYTWYPANSTRATNSKFTAFTPNPQSPFYVNQTINGGQWLKIGCYSFSSGTSGYVELSNQGANGFVEADAVRFEPVAACN